MKYRMAGNPTTTPRATHDECADCAVAPRRRARRRLRGVALAIACCTSACAILPSAPAPAVREAGENPDILWHFIHDACEPAAALGTYPPAPCAEVDTEASATRGYAVLKDRTGRFQYLVLPLARIEGIDSPALLAPDAPNYFADAWTARLYVEAAAHRHLRRDELMLWVNSAHGRSQNQLHIHVGCIRPDVHEALEHLLPTLDEQWRRLASPLPPHAHAYWARWVGGKTLLINPFRSLAASLRAGDGMARHSLVVVGARSAAGEPGFILLSGRAESGADDRANADDLHDLACAIADDSSR